jgi:hypothetical protein
MDGAVRFTYRKQEGGDGYIVFIEGDRIGFVREVGHSWYATDSEFVALRGVYKTRLTASKWLLRRHMKLAQDWRSDTPQWKPVCGGLFGRAVSKRRA